MAVLDERVLERTMKAQEIIMLTVTFGLSPDAGTEMLSTTCASAPER